MAKKQVSGARAIGLEDHPLRDQVRDELRTMIIEQQFQPGERLVEQTLADSFGVSRIPVREALRMLQIEGLVEIVPRRGVVVATLSRADLEHLYDVRTALEVLAFRLAAERGTAKDVKRLEQLLGRARTAVEQKNHTAASRMNVEFHEAIVDIAGNPFLASMLEPLTGRMRFLISQSYEHDRHLAEHAGLVEAIGAHDADRAGAIALAHIRTSRAHALAEYDQKHAQTSA